MSWTRRHWAEALLLALVLAGLVHVVIRFVADGRLPQPFVFDARDTFMDWFNPAWWSHHRGAFDQWGTVYPPISFLLLQLFGQAGCYAGDPLGARDCDGLGIVAIFAGYLASAILAALAFWRADRTTAPIRGVAFALGLPLLFAVERGNLILLCLPFFILAYGNLTRSPAVRAAAAAMTINLKPYLVVPLLAWALERRWRLLKLTVLGASVIYLVSFALFGAGGPGQILTNMLTFAKQETVLVWEQGLYSTSFTPYLALNTAPAPDPRLVIAATPDWFMVGAPVLINATRVLALACFVGAWIRLGAITSARLTLLVIGTYLVGQSPGGYVQTFLVVLIFMERWGRPGPTVALIAAYLLSIPYDVVLWEVLHRPGDSWLSGRQTGHDFGIAVGMYVRPALIVTLVWALGVDSIQRMLATIRPIRADELAAA